MGCNAYNGFEFKLEIMMTDLAIPCENAIKKADSGRPCWDYLYPKELSLPKIWSAIADTLRRKMTQKKTELALYKGDFKSAIFLSRIQLRG